jgi:phytoene desaturase
MSNKIGVIGGGLAGLASACVLASRGYSVILFERSSWLGGKAAVLQEQGYRFDMGPTILTLPSVLRKIYAEAGQNLDDALKLVPCDPQWRCYYNDGSRLDLVGERERMNKILESFSPGSSKGYGDFLEFAKTLHRISDRFYFWRSIGSLWDMFDLKNLFKPALFNDVMKMRMGSTVAEAVRRHVPEPRIAQMIDHFTQYVGSAPDQSPAVLCGIAHMQTEEGIWYPIGGTGAVPRALGKLAGQLGVEVRLNCGIKRIIQDDSAKFVTGVETDSGEQVSLAAIVSNADSVRTHRELMTGSRAAKKFEGRRKYEPACSGVVLYLGLDRRYEHTAHHNFVFSRDPHEEFEYIYRKGQPAPDPTCYVCAPSSSEPEVAPPGGEALYILVHTPYLRAGQDWRKMLPDYRKVIIEKLKTTGAMPDIESRIKFESALTPQDINDRYHVLNGAIYGLASHGRYFGAFKPANRSPDLKGLYLAGGAAHPGPGMPMVLMSGWIAADTLDKDGIFSKIGSGKPVTVPGGVPATPVAAPSLPRSNPASSKVVTEPTQLSANAKVLTALPKRSAWRWKFLLPYMRRMMAKNFHAVRVSKTGKAPIVDGRPVIVVLNHPSWWDPLMAMMLSDLIKGYTHYAPIDADALKQYRIFESLGAFGVEQTAKGAMRFLRTCDAILANDHHALWVTVQGKFSDPRERPIEFRPGVAHVLRRMKNAIVVPLAIEYPFWDERYPEALAHFGPAIEILDGRSHTAEQWQSLLEARLTDALDALALSAQSRNPELFDTLIGGNVGVGGVYDLWRRMKALLGGKKFEAGHSDAVKQARADLVARPDCQGGMA